MGRGAHRLEQTLEQAARDECRRRCRPPSYRDGVQHDPVYEYQRQTKGLLARFGHEADFARLDRMIGSDMARGRRLTLGDTPSRLVDVDKDEPV